MAIDSHQVVAATGASKPVSILIVEDEALVASSVEEVLGELGFVVAGIAASGPEAISLAAQAGPALALVDIRLTGPIDGITDRRDRGGVPVAGSRGSFDFPLRSCGC